MAKLTEKEIEDIILYDEKFRNKFWSYVDKSAGENKCWIWIGKNRKAVINKKKYGQIRIPKSEPMAAHRVSLIMKLKYTPEGDAAHREEICRDNKHRCVNPEHLDDSSKSQNRRDENTAKKTNRHKNDRKTRFQKLMEESSKTERKNFYDILHEEFSI